MNAKQGKFFKVACEHSYTIIVTSSKRKAKNLARKLFPDDEITEILEVSYSDPIVCNYLKSKCKIWV